LLAKKFRLTVLYSPSSCVFSILCGPEFHAGVVSDSVIFVDGNENGVKQEK